MLRFVLISLLLAAGARAQSADSLGVLSLTLNLYPAFVVIDDNYEEAVEVGERSFHTLPAGRHVVRIVLPYQQSPNNVAPITAGDTLRYNFVIEEEKPPAKGRRRHHPAYARILLRSSTFVVTEPGNTVYVDGEVAGTGPQLLALPETAELRVVGEDGKTWRRRVRHDEEGAVAVVDAYLRPERTQATLLRLVPGVYQYYTRGSGYGLALAGAAALGGGAAVWTEARYRADNREYRRLRYQYRQSETEEEFIGRRPGVEAAYDEARKSARVRDVAMGALGTVVAVHALEMVLRPYRGPYRTRVQVRPTLDPGSATFGVITTF